MTEVLGSQISFRHSTSLLMVGWLIKRGALKLIRFYILDKLSLTVSCLPSQIPYGPIRQVNELQAWKELVWKSAWC